MGGLKFAITKALEEGPQPLHTIVARILEDGRLYDTNDIMNALYELSAEQTIERDDETGIIYKWHHLFGGDAMAGKTRHAHSDAQLGRQPALYYDAEGAQQRQATSKTVREIPGQKGQVRDCPRHRPGKGE